MPSTRTSPGLLNTIDCFVEAFNVNNLDLVMTFFDESAIYLPGDGKEHRGLAAIRAAFAPQFDGAFGIMRFDEHDRLTDLPNRKAAIRWICRHDISKAKPKTMGLFLQSIAIKLFVGPTFGWEGVDVFAFNEAGKIISKCTYANYTQPRIRKELGVPRI